MVTIARRNWITRYLIFGILLGAFCYLCQVQDAKADKQTGIRPDVQTRALESVNIEITTHLGDQQSFVEQDIISFLISLDHAAFLYVFYQDASGLVYQLIPGKAQAEHYFQPGFYIPFPPENSAFQFVVQAPFGEEQLWVFASDQGQIEFKGRDSGQGIKQLTQRPLELATSIRAASGALYGESRLIIHTHSR